MEGILGLSGRFLASFRGDDQYSVPKAFSESEKLFDLDGVPIRTVPPLEDYSHRVSLCLTLAVSGSSSTIHWTLTARE